MCFSLICEGTIEATGRLMGHLKSGYGVGEGDSKVKRNQRLEEGGGEARWGLVGGLGVTLMECHSTFEWWEADNQSNVAPKFKSSQASTLSSHNNANNATQNLITVNCG